MGDPPAGEHAATLRSIPLFSDLDDDALDRIAACATEFEIQRGHVLVQPNEPGEGLFVVQEGTAVVERGRDRIELGPGEFFGELALLGDDTRHTARVAALTPLRGLAIKRSDFEDLLQSEPKMALAMLRVLARRLAG